MIDKIFAQLEQHLDSYLKQTLELSESCVISGNLKEPDGSVNQHTVNKVVLTLINTGIDSRHAIPHSRLPQSTNPTVLLNLSVLVASTFKDYSEALKYLSLAMTYFNDHPVIVPDSNQEIAKLTVDLQNTTHEELHHIWQAMGCSYVPSAVYKVRVLAGQ